MGNQGMTNWKFSAFLTIALMLVAGLFSSTAMAAANDGHGTMVALTATNGDASVFLRTTPQYSVRERGRVYSDLYLHSDRRHERRDGAGRDPRRRLEIP